MACYLIAWKKAVLEAVGCILVGAGLWNLAYGVVTIQFGRSEQAGAPGRSPEDAVLCSLRRGRRILLYLWLGGTLIGIGLVFVGHESRNDALADSAFASLWALQILKSLLDRRRQRKLESLMRQRRALDEVTAGR